MILDRYGLGLLLDLSSRVEEVTQKAVGVWETLSDNSHTPEEVTLREIVSGLGKVEKSVSSLISRYPEEVVLQMKQERGEV